MNGLNRTLFQSKRIQILIIVLLTLIAYSNIFQNEFVSGDIEFIVNWPLIRSFHNIPAVFDASAPVPNGSGEYRPLRTVFLIVFYQLWGINTLGYHLVSLITDTVNIVLVYLIIEKITKKRTIAFISSLLFALHPIQTESITFMSVSINTIGINFYLASFYLYLKARDKLPKHSLSYVVSVILAGLAFFHYEMTITLPLIILFYDLCFKHLNLTKINIKNILKIYGPYLVLSLLYIFVRIVLLHITARGEYFGSFYLTILTMTKAFVKYIELLIFPINLSIYPQISSGIRSWVDTYSRLDKILSQSILDLDILRNIGIILSLIAATIIFLKKSPLISFSIGWFLISLLPVLNIIPIGFIAQERYLYIALFSFVLLIGLIFSYLFYLKYPPSIKRVVKGSLIALIVIITLVYSYRTYLRNKDYRNNIVFWSKIIEQNPADEIAYWILSEHYAQADQDDLAIKYMLKAADLNPNFNQEELNIGLGRVYNKRGEKAKALENFRKSKDLKEYQLESSAPGLSENRIIFFYPKQWQVTSVNSGVRIDDKNGYSGEIILDHLAMSRDDYLGSQKVQGDIVQQGLAKIPNVDIAYAREIYDNGNDLIQLFWFKENKVIKIIYPAANFAQRNTFENILRSFVILD